MTKGTWGLSLEFYSLTFSMVTSERTLIHLIYDMCSGTLGIGFITHKDPYYNVSFFYSQSS